MDGADLNGKRYKEKRNVPQAGGNRGKPKIPEQLPKPTVDPETGAITQNPIMVCSGPGRRLERATLPHSLTQCRRQECQVDFVLMLGEEACGSRTERLIAFDALELCAGETLTIEGDGKEAAALRSVGGQEVEHDLPADAHASEVGRHQVEVVLRPGSAGRNHDGRELLGRRVADDE